jgi:class 3 adenylate cyclase
MDKDLQLGLTAPSLLRIPTSTNEDLPILDSRLSKPTLRSEKELSVFIKRPPPRGLPFHKFFRHYLTIFVYFLALVYFLFSNDGRLFGLDTPAADSYFSGVNVLVFIFFGAYFAYFLATQKRYLLSVFAFTDIFLLVLTILDIPQVRTAISSADGSQHKWVSRFFLFLFGTARLAVINKFIQLWYLPKYWRNFDPESLCGESSSSAGLPAAPTHASLASDTTKVNLWLLVMLFLFFFFNADLFPSISNDFGPVLTHINTLLSRNQTAGLQYLNEEFPRFFVGKAEELVYVEFPSNVSIFYSNTTDFRAEELFWIPILLPDTNATTPGHFPSFIHLILSIRLVTRAESMLLIVRNLLVVCLYAIFVLVNQYVLSRFIFRPYERLSERMVLHHNHFAKPETTLNTDCFVIEKESLRIKQILVRGFGKAAELLLHRIFSIDGSLDFKEFKNTRSVFAIFGFCDIRRFTDVSEALGKRVIQFVNVIAEIVHLEVQNSGGAPNKNVGDAFMVVWILEDEESEVAYITDPKAQELQIKRLTNRETRLEASKTEDSIPELSEFVLRKIKANQRNSNTAESALICILKIIVKLQTSEQIARINSDPEIKSKLPDFSVKIGFGLHAGAAIEGGIGSYYKLDMAYMGKSPMMAMTLEGLTKEYKVGLLFTQSIVNLMESPRLKQLCREVRSLHLESQNATHRLYTVDFAEGNEVVPGQAGVGRRTWESNWDFRRIDHIDRSWESVTGNTLLARSLGVAKPEHQLEAHMEDLHLSNRAVTAYLNRNWVESNRLFSQLKHLRPDQVDIVEELRRNRYVCPPGHLTMKVID